MKHILILFTLFTFTSCIVEEDCYSARECVDIYDYDDYGVRFYSHTECYRTFVCDDRIRY